MRESAVYLEEHRVAFVGFLSPFLLLHDKSHEFMLIWGGFGSFSQFSRYAMSEFKFALTEPVADQILKRLSEPGTKGIAKGEFQRIKAGTSGSFRFSKVRELANVG